MRGALLQRLAAAAVVLLLVLTATFALLHLAPGEPGVLIQDPRLTVEQREHLTSLWGLDRPLPIQYLSWLSHVVRGDWGTSYHYRRPAGLVVAEALPNTLLLGAAALLVQLTVGVGLGVAAARRAGSRVDNAIQSLAVGVYSIPTFWLAIVAVLFFSYTLGLFPSSHMYRAAGHTSSLLGRSLDLLHHLALPALVLGLSAAGSLVRFVRTGLLEASEEPFVRAARARGLSDRAVTWRHTLRPSAGPLVQVVALSIPALLSGAVVTEVIFAWPGLGRVAYQAMLGRDYPVVLACTAWSAVVVVAATLVADGFHAALDPRTRDDV